MPAQVFVIRYVSILFHRFWRNQLHASAVTCMLKKIKDEGEKNAKRLHAHLAETSTNTVYVDVHFLAPSLSFLA